MSEIVEYQGGIMSLHEAQERRNALTSFVNGNVLRDGFDYGIVPGTGGKKTLLKPGAEKLATFFHLTPRFEADDKIIDFSQGLFYFQYRCTLYTREGMEVGQGIGSCNSYESKYRWRKAGRVCPECGVENIRRSKRDGGWYCWDKTGGCGANFDEHDTRITEQETGRVPNPDPADQLNTIDKMAQKRAFVAAVLIATNASEFFTQDMEDFNIMDGEYAEVEAPRSAQTTSRKTRQTKEEYRGGADDPPPPDIPFLSTPPTAKKAPQQNGDDNAGKEGGHLRTGVIAALKDEGWNPKKTINTLNKMVQEGRADWSLGDDKLLEILRRREDDKAEVSTEETKPTLIDAMREDSLLCPGKTKAEALKVLQLAKENNIEIDAREDNEINLDKLRGMISAMADEGEMQPTSVLSEWFGEDAE